MYIDGDIHHTRHDRDVIDFSTQFHPGLVYIVRSDENHFVQCTLKPCSGYNQYNHYHYYYIYRIEIRYIDVDAHRTRHDRDVIHVENKFHPGLVYVFRTMILKFTQYRCFVE